MSRAATRVSSPAQRPTIVSTPSAPITTRAVTVSSPPGPRSRTRQRPPPGPSARSRPTASVLMRISAPARAARSASSGSKRVRSST